MGRFEDLTPTWPLAGEARVPHAVWHAIGLIVALLLGYLIWHTIGLVVALLLGYLIWRGYQSPEFLLDLAAFRLC